MSAYGFPEKNLSCSQFLCERVENLKGSKALDTIIFLLSRKLRFKNSSRLRQLYLYFIDLLYTGIQV